MDEKERKKQYTAEVFTAAMVMGLGLFVVMFLQYLLRDAGGVLSLLLSFATFAVVVAVLIIYGRRAAALCPPGALPR